MSAGWSPGPAGPADPLHALLPMLPANPGPTPTGATRVVTPPSPACKPDTGNADARGRGPQPGCPLPQLGDQPGLGRRAEFPHPVRPPLQTESREGWTLSPAPPAGRASPRGVSRSRDRRSPPSLRDPGEGNDGGRCFCSGAATVAVVASLTPSQVQKYPATPRHRLSKQTEGRGGISEHKAPGPGAAPSGGLAGGRKPRSVCFAATEHREDGAAPRPPLERPPRAPVVARDREV